MEEEKTSILKIMVKDHRRIEDLIDSVEKSLDDDFEVIEKAFDKFEWQLQKHIFAEEKAIFTFYEPEDVSTGYKMLPVLTKQHNDILNRMEIMQRDVQNGKTPKKVSEFKKVLMKHRTFEEVEVYPKLQETLSKKQKDQIIEKVKMIL
ncbi:MAG: hemerythrin domain-containing protein [Candidatus Thermoplasmatota archaeon]|nr:hemerythrin domain-containing protein [Candidatus Thermoplasmatota archaeon]